MYGTLLPTGRHLLTAAHCFNDAKPDETWYVDFWIGEQQELVVASFHNVDDVYIHPTFLFNDNDYLQGFDIAIIELTPVSCTECSPTESLDSLTRYDVFRPEFGSDLTDIEIVGYGFQGHGEDGTIIPPLIGAT